jgi:replicative DNA helicase
VSDDHQWNKDLERAVLGVVLDGRHKESWGTLTEILPHPGYFFARDHQLLYLAMVALAERGVPIDASAVAQECQATVYRDAVERLQWVRQLEDADQMVGSRASRELWRLPPPPAGVDYSDSLLVAIGGFNAVTNLAEAVAPASSLDRNCRHLVEHYRQRRLLKLLATATATLSSAKGMRSVAEVGAGIITGASRELGQAGGDVSMAAAIDEAVQLGDQAFAEGGVAHALWGIPTLDVKAPLTRDTFAVLAAPPKCGKTSLLMQVVEGTADKFGADSVAICSREMSPPELARILIARRLGIPSDAVRAGTLSRGEREQLAAEVEHWKNTRSVVIQADSDRVTVDKVCAWARQRHLLAGGRLRLLVIDYLQLLDSVNPRHEEYQRVSHATRSLKLLQRALRIPVLVLSQYNRKGTTAARSVSGDLGAMPEPQLTDLRGSGSIEQDANTVVMLWPRQPPNATQHVTIKIAANRSGPTGLIDCAFHMARGQVFTELQAERTEERAGRMETVPTESEDLFG